MAAAHSASDKALNSALNTVPWCPSFCLAPAWINEWARPNPSHTCDSQTTTHAFCLLKTLNIESLKFALETKDPTFGL